MDKISTSVEKIGPDQLVELVGMGTGQDPLGFFKKNQYRN